MKHGMAIQKCLIFGLVLMVCAGSVGAVQARRAAAPQGSIQFMIDAAPDGSTVNIPAGTFNETLTVNKNLTLKGVSLTETILQPANSNQRVITVTERHDLRLEYLRVTGGHPTASGDDGGGGVYLAGGSLELDHVQIDHNKASYGGGVFQKGDNRSVTVTNSMIENNTASFSGGGIFVSGSATLTDTSLVNNTASNHGGGMHVNTGAASLTGGAVTGNHVLNGNGGGVNVNNGLAVAGTTFTNNTAAGISDSTGSGGAITQWNVDQIVSINGAAFNGNSAQVNGGAVYIKQSFLTLTNSTFTGNTVDSGSTANTYGGGVYAGGGLDGSGLTFTSNSAKCLAGCSFQHGGGLYIMRPSPGASTITLSTFDGNKAWSGSGIFSATSVQLTLTSSTFMNNGSLASGVFTGYGGGVEAYWVHGDKLLFQNNRVMNAGGALHASHLVLTNSHFIGNTASAAGGGAVYANNDFTGTNLLFAGNDSPNGAAVYVDTGPAVLKHVTIGRPTRGAGSGIYVKSGATLELKNSIISANDVGLRALGTATEDYNLYFNNRLDSDSAGGTIVSGGHNVALKDPLFVNPAGNDYHLRPASPAIGKGADVGIATDLDGRARLGRMDIGAYQFWASVYIPMLRK